MNITTTESCQKLIVLKNLTAVLMIKSIILCVVNDVNNNIVIAGFRALFNVRVTAGVCTRVPRAARFADH